MIRFFTLLMMVAWLPGLTLAADPPAWEGLLGSLAKDEKSGFGGLCGVIADPATGSLWINLSDRGFYRSDDQGKTFRRCGDMQPRGRTESPGCFQLDPTGGSKRLVTALVYGSPISISANAGLSWKQADAKSSHIDWCAVDWTDPDLKFMLALKHEADGLLLASRDGGASFSEIGKGYGSGWVFNEKTAVVAEAKTRTRPKPSLMRTTDAGQTWQPCGAYSPVGANSAQALPQWREGSLYWLVDGALIASNDLGTTWQKKGDVKDGRYGPVFGKDAKHLFVLTGVGIIESTDGGTTWARPISPPRGLNGIGGLTWLAYDARGDNLYLMKMGSDLFRLARGR